MKRLTLATVFKVDCWRQGQKEGDQAGGNCKVQAKGDAGLDKDHSSRGGG